MVSFGQGSRREENYVHGCRRVHDGREVLHALQDQRRHLLNGANNCLGSVEYALSGLITGIVEIGERLVQAYNCCVGHQMCRLDVSQAWALYMECIWNKHTIRSTSSLRFGPTLHGFRNSCGKLILPVSWFYN